ncbi:MAG: methyltransferase [Candidatus Methylomirabilia bacterium]
MDKRKTAKGPGEILGISGAYWKSLALHAGVRLDLFTVIGEARLAGAEIARLVEGDERGVTTLLEALAALGLLDRTDGGFANAPAARTYLVRGSASYIGFMVRHHANLVPSWNRLHEAALAGGPVRDRASHGDVTELEDFLMGMHGNSLGTAARAAREIDLGGGRRLLDLGGGPGTWSVQFALANPGLHATIFDLPTSRPFAERIAGESGLADRISFVGGDFTEDELPGGFDVAWLSHILHGEGPATCRAIIGKAARALELGGLLLVHEFILDDTRTSPVFPALFSLNMLTGTAEGRSYSLSELSAMLAAAGARDVRLLPFTGPTESRVLAATV